VDRHRCFLFGVLLILLGVQFRMVESFVLTEQATRTLAKMSKDSPMASNGDMNSFWLAVHPHPTKKVELPRWIGIAMICVGAVLTLQAYAMPKQGG
jgi:hypothetical protein